MTLIDELRRLGVTSIRENEPMAPRTTLGVGGPADVLVEVETEDELAALMRYVSGNGLSWFLLGDGANLLVSDKGIRGIVIHLGVGFERVDVDGKSIDAGAAVSIARVADIAAEHDLSGLEGVGTVPGTLGGAIVMNAGTYRGYMDEVVRTVRIVTVAGEQRELSREDCGFSYRGSRFQSDRSMIITSVVMDMHNGDGAAIRQHLAEMRKHRQETQPQGKSAGCFFKNPPNGSAGKLIEAAGGKGLREGGAVVSDIHGNFIMNAGDATAQDLYSLAERVRAMVRDKHGVELEYEVRLVGEW